MLPSLGKLCICVWNLVGIVWWGEGGRDTEDKRVGTRWEMGAGCSPNIMTQFTINQLD